MKHRFLLIVKPWVRLLAVACLVMGFGVAGCTTGAGTPKVSGNLESDQRSGPWKFYYSEGPIWVTCEYRVGLLNGRWERFYADGSVQESGGYANGLPHGDWIWYYPDGTTYVSGHFEYGEKNGAWESHTASGMLWWRGTFKNGLKDGSWEAWQGGQQRTIGHFRNGKRHGDWTQFDANGWVRFKGRFANGEQTGRWYEYDAESNIVRSADYDLEPRENQSVGFRESDRIKKLKKALQELLPPTFMLAGAGRFAVVSELPRYITDTYIAYTISWLDGHMMRDYCRTAPPVADKTIYLFRHRRSYDFYSNKWIGQSLHGATAVMTPTKIMVDASSGSGSLVHELVHGYLQADFPRIPDWLEEGLAELYEQSAEIDGRMVGLVNFRLRRLQDAMRKGQLISLKRLLTREKVSDETDLWDAQVRYLCYYLQERHVLRAFYRSLRDNHDTDSTGVETLKRVMGKKNLKTIEREWHAFLRGLAI
ncbi:MAG: hypothetical protein JRH15_01120 [Deltaproteobacteria bacterium]|nr:hypothetical protein [Deltaproteobacteria bacterium]